MTKIKPKIVVIFPKTRPSHLARLNTLVAKDIYSVIGIEIVALNQNSSWGGRKDTNKFDCYTLFYENDGTKINSALIWKKLQATLDEISPQIVAVPGWSKPSALAALAWALSHQVPPILLSESSEDDRNIIKKAIKRKIIKTFSSALVGGTPQTQYLQSIGFSKTCIFQGYNVVDNEHFLSGSQNASQNPTWFCQKFNLPEQYFLISSRLIKRKNLFRVVDAYAKYNELFGKNAWKLVIIGEGDLYDKLYTYIKDLNLVNSIFLFGWQEYDDLPVFYGLAGAFIHASIFEPWGMVVNEALAAGLPVIVSNRCGCAFDLVQEGKNGFKFCPYDIDLLASLMGTISNSDCDKEAMGNSSKTIINAWSPTVFADNLVKAANQVLGMQKSRFQFSDQALLWSLARFQKL